MKRGTTALVLLAALCLTGCDAKGQTPAEDDVAQAQPETGLVEAWEGEMAEGAPEEAESGAHIERNDLYDENGVLYGYDICEYDAQDRITLEEQFDLDGNSINRWERSYSEDGLECETLIYSDGEFNSRLVTLSNEQGMSVEQRLFDVAGTLQSLTYYDENGEISLTENYMGEAGAEWKYAELTYGENGSMEERIFTPEGNLDSVWKREYDEYNRHIRDLVYEGGAFKWDHRYVYDGQDQCIRMDFCDESGATVEYRLMEYTPSGLLAVQTEYDGADVLTARKVWEYTADGRVLSRYHYNGDGQIREYTLMEYDEQNRIKREESFDDKDESLGHTYYKYAEDGSYEVFSYYGDNRLAWRERYDADGYLIERIDG